MAAQESAARLAGRQTARKFRQRHRPGSGGPPAEWPELRRAILAEGGIGPSPDWDRADIPGDLYRERGTPPDVVAAQTMLGRADTPPWGEGGDDNVMMRYLRRAHEEWEATPAAERYSIADPELAARRRQLRHGREQARFDTYGTRRRDVADEQAEHERRMRAFVARARAAHRAKFQRPATGFYTDDSGEVRPITAPRHAGGARLRHA